MEREETYNIIDAKNAVNSFKTKEGRKRFTKRYGGNMFGKGKPSKISANVTTEARTGSVTFWTRQ